MFTALLPHFFVLFVNYFSMNFSDGKYLALASGKIRVLSLENGKELLKFPDELVSYLSCLTYLGIFLVCSRL